MSRAIRRDGDDVIIRIPMEDVHAFRVALRPVLAGETVSKSTQDIRDGIDKALARLQSQGK